MNLRSLRFRLGLWAAALAVVVMIGFGAYTYYGLRRYSRTLLEGILRHRAERIGETLLTSVPTQGEDYIGSQIELRYAPALNERFVRVSRSTGEVLYRSAEPQDHSFVAAGLPPPAGANSRVVSGGNGYVLLVALPYAVGGQSYLIEVGASLAPTHALLHGLVLTLAAALPVVLILILAGAYVLIGRSLGPVRNLVAAAQEISLLHLTRRLPVPPSGDEVESLSVALNQMIARLDESFQHSSRFTADASHELRTPLTIVRGELEQLLNSKRLPSDAQATIASVLEEIERLVSIVERLFSLARLDAGEAQAESVRVDLAALAQGTIEQMYLLAEEKKIALRFPPSAPVEVLGDRSRLKQIIVNLLDNAIKYTPAGGEVDLRVRREEGSAVLEISDNGPGVAEEAVPRLFDRFYRGGRTSVDGAGIGLSIVHAICAAHGGTVVARNLQPTGLRIVVSLPRAL